MVALAAQDDKKFFEATITLDSERGQKWANATVGEYLARTGDLLQALESFGVSTEQEDKHHKALAKHILAKISDESDDIIEQAALTAMVGTSMLATFDGLMDYIELQMQMLDLESGGNKSDGA